MNSFAPIIVFAFNRIDCLKNTISSILNNKEARQSDLFVFVDGPRTHKKDENKEVEAVQEYVKSIDGFKSCTYTFSEHNNGLAKSIINGVSSVIKQYGKAIILEDDLALTPNCLSYFNQALEHYQNDKNVFSICGYTNTVKRPNHYAENTYFCTRSSSWGWATWADRWNSVDWKLENWEQVKTTGKAFNKWGGSDCWHMLNKWHEGKISSWAIRFCYAQFIQNKVSLFPTKSLIGNDGFDGNGTNCKKWSRFQFELDNSNNKDFSWPETTDINPVLYKEAMKYHSIWIRIYSRIMYAIYDIKNKIS